MSDKVDLREMFGKVIECKTSDKRSRKKLRMRKIDL